MDFVTGLPSSEGYDAICVIVDRFMKKHHLISCTTTIDTEEFGELVISEGFRLHGLSQTATSNRGPQFIAKFGKCLCKTLNIQPGLLSPYHPPTNGQAERLNTVMKQYLRCYVNYL